MGINERRERDKQEMRKLVLDTAMRLFLDQGFQHVSIRRIAEEIEYSPATIYLYFKDKDEILYALHNTGFEELYKRQLEVSSIKDPARRLVRHGELYLTFALEHPEYYNLMFIMRSPLRNLAEGEHWDAGMRSYDFFKKDVQRAMEAGLLIESDLNLATFALWSLSHGIAALILRNRCPMLDQSTLPAVVQQAFAFHMQHYGFLTPAVADKPQGRGAQERQTIQVTKTR